MGKKLYKKIVIFTGLLFLILYLSTVISAYMYVRIAEKKIASETSE